MKFQRFRGGTIELGSAVVAVLDRYRQLEAGAQEAGGMLLGRLISESNDLVIDEATEPGKRDRKGRYFFFRGRSHAQKRVDEVWYRSHCTVNYLGEWHSHPEDDPSPSCADINNWRRISSKARYEQDCLAFVIAGREKTRIWEFCKGSGKLYELQLLDIVNIDRQRT
jgi:integrative and conjugative element protein (TIGR02256 family)